MDGTFHTAFDCVLGQVLELPQFLGRSQDTQTENAGIVTSDWWSL